MAEQVEKLMSRDNGVFPVAVHVEADRDVHGLATGRRLRSFFLALFGRVKHGTSTPSLRRRLQMDSLKPIIDCIPGGVCLVTEVIKVLVKTIFTPNLEAPLFVVWQWPQAAI